MKELFNKIKSYDSIIIKEDNMISVYPALDVTDNIKNKKDEKLYKEFAEESYGLKYHSDNTGKYLYYSITRIFDTGLYANSTYKYFNIEDLLEEGFESVFQFDDDQYIVLSDELFHFDWSNYEMKTYEEALEDYSKIVYRDIKKLLEQNKIQFTTNYDDFLRDYLQPVNFNDMVIALLKEKKFAEKVFEAALNNLYEVLCQFDEELNREDI